MRQVPSILQYFLYLSLDNCNCLTWFWHAKLTKTSLFIWSRAIHGTCYKSRIKIFKRYIWLILYLSIWSQNHLFSLWMSTLLNNHNEKYKVPPYCMHICKPITKLSHLTKRIPGWYFITFSPIIIKNEVIVKVKEN